MSTADQFPVKWMHSGMPRAPALTLEAGSLISVLDAFLITGWGAMTPQRIHVEGGVATVQCNSGDTFIEHTVIKVSGAEQPELNGQHRVLGSTATSFTFATNAPDGYATGTISIKAAPAGWQKVFSAEKQAVYRGCALDAPLHYWHIDASDGYRAKVRGFAAMSAIDTGEYPFPPAGTDTFFWCGWQEGSGRQAYMLAADSAACIAAPASTIGSFSGAATSGHATFFLGALAPFAGAAGQTATDAAICGLSSWSIGNQARGWHGAQWSVGHAGSYMAGASAGYDAAARAATFYSAKGNLSMGNVGQDDSPALLPCLCYDAGGARGAVPGLFASSYTSAASIASFEFFQGGAALGARLFVAVPCGHGNGWPNEFMGFAFVDITGPWR